jgi:hypothetical protein
MEHVTDTPAPLCRWLTGDLMMIEDKMILEQRWTQPDGSLGPPTDEQLAWLVKEVPRYVAWYTNLIAAIRSEIARRNGKAEADPSRIAIAEIPSFGTWHIDEIGYLHDEVKDWHLKALGACKFRPLDRFEEEDLADEIPDYWSWFKTMLDGLREEIVVRHIADLNTVDEIEQAMQLAKGETS